MEVSRLNSGAFAFVDASTIISFDVGKPPRMWTLRPVSLDTWRTHTGRFAMGKTCNKCGRTLPITEFHRNPNTPDGHTYSCRDCCAAYQREYRRKNRERLRQDKKKYVDENRESVLASKRQYAADHREQESARAIQWQKDHPDRVIQRSKLRRFRERANGGSIDWQAWLELCALFRNRCACCGKRRKLEMDHIVPVVQGGSGDITNLQPLCRSCNARKYNQTIDYRPSHIKEWAEEVR